ncbi:MarR family winged helix-turn-helix transcriptional regulator [Fundidesulfovibrio terrae]|uniref:MarR family winged helix-turn-helix transcriptional regulator n=1 Tax=Fundidesulfovibrio terrae TaxID=2922866 RepID=UPI001FAED36D|nr:MarR family transcriptional regulator [Fundidesulfovibrio terrae]
MIFKELPSFETLLESSERYPEMDIKACVAWIHTVHAGAILQRRIERELNKEGLSYGRFIILVLLASENNGLPVCKLAAMSCVTSPTMSSVITAMERDGLIRRDSEPTDKRIVRVNLTPEGRETINKIAPIFFKNQSAAMSGLDDQELRSLVLLLSNVNLEV